MGCTACCQTKTSSYFGCGKWASLSSAGIYPSPFLAFPLFRPQNSSVPGLEGIGEAKYAKLKDCCFSECYSSTSSREGKQIYEEQTCFILFPSQFLYLPKINITLIQALLTHITVWVHWSPASFANNSFIQFLFACFCMTENIHLYSMHLYEKLAFRKKWLLHSIV